MKAESDHKSRLLLAIARRNSSTGRKVNPAPLINPDASAHVSQPRDLSLGPPSAAPMTRADRQVAGYTLRECIGTGGYGEVWKADAPGGLEKAVKLVYGRLDDTRAACEQEALNRIKEVRHPFLLSLERIEVVEGQLVIVTELAEKSLKDRFDECIAEGMTGVPRDELLLYLSDAAEALDYMCERFQLQHLDIKPENLLILAGRVKVADFGLVRQVQEKTVTMMGGLTPAYAPPESFTGRPGRVSDQYSLAIVYQEMLTGVLPFPGRTAIQLAEQHQNSPPFLASLPEYDRTIIGRALSKTPEERFPSCSALVAALRHASTGDVLMVDDQLHESKTLVFQGGEAVYPDVTAALAPTDSVHAEDTSAPLAGEASSQVTEQPPAEQAPPQPSATEAGTMVLGPESPDSGSAVTLPPEPAAAASTAAPTVRPAQPSRPSPPSVADLAARKPIIAPSANAAWRPLETLPAVEYLGEQALRPTLVLGLGGLAGRVLRDYRARIAARFGEFDAVAAWRMLFLDVDRHAIRDVSEGKDPGALRLEETLALPLRHPKSYRTESGDLLRWLSRRWLYNIPRSLLTEGLRPLGRLAFVEQAAAIRERLERMIQEIQDADNIKSTKKRTSLDVDTQRVTVWIVASSSGGTGGGAAIDLGHMARQMLAEAGCENVDVHGMLLHATPSDPNRAELAIANTCTTLAELAHFDSGEYPGDPACNLASSTSPTFDHPYFIHMGDHLDQSALETSTASVADYLFLNTACRASGLFDYFRDPEQHQEQVRTIKPSSEDGIEEERPLAHLEHDVPLLRTVGVEALGCSQGGVPEAAAAVLCGELVRRWRGKNVEEQPVPEPPKPEETKKSAVKTKTSVPKGEPEAEQQVPSRTAQLRELAENWAGEHEFDFNGVFQRMGTCVFKSLGGPLDQSPEELAATLLMHTDTGAAIQELDTIFGAASQQEAGEERPLPQPIMNSLAKDAHAFGNEVSRFIIDLANDVDVRVTGAQRIADWFVERIETLLPEIETARRERRERLSELLDTVGDADRRRGLFARILGGKRDKGNQWIDVVTLRREILAISAMDKWMQRIQRRIREVQDQLRAMTLELDVLVEQFNVTDQWAAMAAGLNDEDRLPSANDELRRMVLNTLNSKLPELAASLDNDFRTTHFGKAKTLTDTLGAHKTGLSQSVMAAARAAVFGVLEEIDVANLLLPASNLPELADQLVRCVRESEPRLMNCGGEKRLVLVYPRGTDGGPLQNTIEAGAEQPVSLVADTGGDIFLCHEIEHIALDAIIQRLSGHRSEYLAAAERLHTRVDVQWRPIV